MEIRPLQVGDLFTIARMLGKASVNREKLTSPEEAWCLLTGEAGGDFMAWLADLAGKGAAEFGAMPAIAALDVIEKLTEQDDFQDFLLYVGILAGPDSHERLVNICDIFRREYGLCPNEMAFSRFNRILGEVHRNLQKEVNDTLAEAEEILTMAKGEGK